MTYTGPGTVTVQADLSVAGSDIRATLNTTVVEPQAFSPQAAAMAQLIQSILSTQMVNEIINPLGPDVAPAASRATAIQLLNSLQSFVNVVSNAQ